MSYKGCDSPPQISTQTDSWESLSKAITGKFLTLWHWQHSPISTLNSSSNGWVRFYHSCVNASKYCKHRLSHQTWVPCKWSGFAQSFVPGKATDSETREQSPTPASPPASAAHCHELIHCLSEKTFGSAFLLIFTNGLSPSNLSSASPWEWYPWLCQLAINYFLSELLSISIMKYRCKSDTPLIQNKQPKFSIVLRN